MSDPGILLDFSEIQFAANDPDSVSRKHCSLKFKILMSDDLKPRVRHKFIYCDCELVAIK